VLKLLDKNKDGKLSLEEMSGMLMSIVMIVKDEFD